MYFILLPSINSFLNAKQHADIYIAHIIVITRPPTSIHNSHIHNHIVRSQKILLWKFHAIENLAAISPFTNFMSTCISLQKG